MPLWESFFSYISCQIGWKGHAKAYPKALIYAWDIFLIILVKRIFKISTNDTLKCKARILEYFLCYFFPNKPSTWKQGSNQAFWWIFVTICDPLIINFVYGLMISNIIWLTINRLMVNLTKNNLIIAWSCC